MLNRGETDEERVDQLKEQLNEKLDVYEKILSKRPFLGGQVRLVRLKTYVKNRF